MMQTHAAGHDAACARCGSAIAADDLRCTLCGLATPGGMEAPAQALASILRCTQCGAAVSYLAENQAPTCAYCGAVMRLEQPRDPVEQAERALPFRISPQQAEQAMRAWMQTLGWFRPSDLVSGAKVQSLTPIWWASWIFDAQALVSWTADSNAGSGRSAWAPHAGQSEVRFENVVVSASRGLSLAECARLTPHFDLREAVHPGALTPVEQAHVERFDLQRSAARRAIAQAIEAVAAHRMQRSEIPGNRFRNVRVAVLLRQLRTTRVALPTYVLAYRYGDRVYRAVVHGQDARCTFGEAPYSWGKIALTVLGALAVVGGILFFVLLLAALAGRS